jgi:hypothetical protein
LQAASGRLAPFGDRVRLSPATADTKRAQGWLDRGERGLDGVMAKRLDLPYQSGERPGMVKIKNVRTVDCVVGGFRYAQKEPIVGSLLLGLYGDDGLLHHVGFTSSISREERRELTLTALAAGGGLLLDGTKELREVDRLELDRLVLRPRPEVPPEEVDRYRVEVKLRFQVITAASLRHVARWIASGEEECGRQSFRPLIDGRCLDVYQVDLSRNGFTDAAYLRQRVEEIGARLCNHCYTSPVTVAASLHWLATCRDAFLFEDCVEDSPLRHALTHERVQAVDGWIEVPDRPGLGVTLDEEFVGKHLVSESR